MKTETKQKIWAVILTLGLILFFATGCKTRTILVPVKETKIEYRDRLRVDSIYNRDTVEVYGINDTIFKNVIKWRERFKLLIVPEGIEMLFCYLFFCPLNFF